MKEIIQNKQLLLYVGLLLTLSLLFNRLSESSWFSLLFEWSKSNKIILFGLLVLIKIIGIVWPPMPGGLFTVASIPLLGWQTAYAADLVGVLLGGGVAYRLGEKYGQKLVNNLFDAELAAKIGKAKIREGKEIEAIFMIRVISGGVILEAVCYASGLLKVKFKNFAIGLVSSHLVVGITSFFMASLLFTKENQILGILSLLIAIPVLARLKNRYFVLV